jgi:hypothetical protein
MRSVWWRYSAIAGLTLALGAGASAALVTAGKQAPDWSGKTLAGKTLKSTDLKGKVVVMNFFSYS